MAFLGMKALESLCKLLTLLHAIDMIKHHLDRFTFRIGIFGPYMEDTVMVNFEHAVDAWFSLWACCRQGKMYFTDQRVVGGHLVLSLKNAEADAFLTIS